MLVTEWLSATGLPARVLGRLPLLVRYAYNPVRLQSEYGKRRYHNYHLRIWLRLDIQELEAIEDIIDGTDEEVNSFRKSRLDTASTTGAVGGLLASASSAILTIESIADIHYIPRGLFTLSLLLALLSVYFTLLQQRELLAMNADTLRIWLWDGDQASGNGATPNVSPGDVVPSTRPTRYSSLAANTILQAPFELLAISITLFLAALGFYLGLLYATKIKVSEGWDSNLAVLAAFVATAVFSLGIFGQALGQKDREMAKDLARESMDSARKTRREFRRNYRRGRSDVCENNCGHESSHGVHVVQLPEPINHGMVPAN